MENFIYSLNATVPVFLVMVVGWFLKQIGMLNDNFVTVANKFNFKITLPILLLCDLSDMDIYSLFDMKFMMFCVIVTLICICGVWILGKLIIKDKYSVGSFIQGSFRGSVAVLGVAFVQNIYGDSGLAPLMLIASVPIYNIFSVIVLTFNAQNSTDNQSEKIKQAIHNICTNPIILGILAGAICSVLRISFPPIVDKTLNSFADMATPLALVAIGAGFNGTKALGKIKETFLATLIKLIVQPLIFLPLAIYFGFRNQELIAILIMLGAPTTASSYIMAKNMGNDDVLASSIIVATTLLSSISLTFFIYLLRCLGAV